MFGYYFYFRQHVSRGEGQRGRWREGGREIEKEREGILSRNHTQHEA